MLDRRPDAVVPSRPDPLVALGVVLLTVLTLGLVIAMVLAVYDWRTPGAVAPLAIAGSAVFGAAILVIVIGATFRWARSGLR